VVYNLESIKILGETFLEEVDFQADETAPGDLIATRGWSDSQPRFQGGLTANYYSKVV
jgi:hypothetical protein